MVTRAWRAPRRRRWRVEGAKRGFARGRVWPRRLLDARRYPLSRYRREGARRPRLASRSEPPLSEASIFPSVTRQFINVARKQSATFVKRYFFGAGGSPLQARRRLWCATVVRARGCRAGVSARSPSEMGKKAKGKHRLGACPLPSSPNRAPPGCARAVSSGPPPPAPTPKRKAPMTRAPPERRRRRRVRHPARLRSRDAVSRWKRFDHPVSFPRLSAPPPARHGRTPRRYSSTAALRHSCPIRHRQVLLPGEGAGLPLARVVQARAAEPQV